MIASVDVTSPVLSDGIASYTPGIFCQRWAVAWYKDCHFAEHRTPKGFVHITVTAEELQVVPKIKFLYGFYRLASFYCPTILAYDLRYLSASMKRPGVVHVVYPPYAVYRSIFWRISGTSSAST
jgi:hypothetical protein